MNTFLWYDYETHGSDAMYARPASFGSIRTDMDLNTIGEHVEIVCRMADDFLPSPFALLVHRLSVHDLQNNGMPESEFARVIYREMNQPETISSGFNTANFDVKITHGIFYRNLLSMYNWHMGLNSRFDIHDLVRLVAAIDPTALAIPTRNDGTPSFKLDDLAAANNIPLGGHNALADVLTTIALAKRIKAAQPAVWQYALRIRTKQMLSSELHQYPSRIFLHSASYYGADCSYVAPILPIAITSDKQCMIVVNLSDSMDQLFQLSSEQLRELLFTKKELLPDGVARPPLNQIKLNASAGLVPLADLNAQQLRNAGIDHAQCEASAQTVRNNQSLHQKLIRVFEREAFEPSTDIDDQMYDRFPSSEDAREIANLLNLSPQQIAQTHPNFAELKYRKLLGRFVARNYPEMMTSETRAKWEQMRLDFIFGRAARNGLTFADFRVEMEQARTRATETGDHTGLELLADLDQYAATLVQSQIQS